MRLFHVSEEPDITVFEPRLPKRADLDPAVGLVWAIDEARLPNFLTPRDCPRVTYHIGSKTTEAGRKLFFSPPVFHTRLSSKASGLRSWQTPRCICMNLIPANSNCRTTSPATMWQK